jgi:hypothetical protein
MSDTIIVTFLRKTRNPTLDELCQGHSLSSHGADELKEHRLKFGILMDSGWQNRPSRAAFGVQDEVSPITRT